MSGGGGRGNCEKPQTVCVFVIITKTRGVLWVWNPARTRSKKHHRPILWVLTVIFGLSFKLNNGLNLRPGSKSKFVMVFHLFPFIPCHLLDLIITLVSLSTILFSLFQFCFIFGKGGSDRSVTAYPCGKRAHCSESSVNQLFIHSTPVVPVCSLLGNFWKCVTDSQSVHFTLHFLFLCINLSGSRPNLFLSWKEEGKVVVDTPKLLACKSM